MDFANCITQIKDRILAPVPGAASIELPEGSDSNAAARQLLEALSPNLEASHLVPVVFDCQREEEPVAFWKAVFNSIWEAMLPLMDDETRDFEQGLCDEVHSASSTAEVYVCLESLLEELGEAIGRTPLLVMSNFDTLIARQDEPDVMKVRNMAQKKAVVVALSFEPLERLCTERYGNAYFSNEFAPYTLD